MGWSVVGDWSVGIGQCLGIVVVSVAILCGYLGIPVFGRVSCVRHAAYLHVILTIHTPIQPSVGAEKEIRPLGSQGNGGALARNENGFVLSSHPRHKMFCF